MKTNAVRFACSTIAATMLAASLAVPAALSHGDNKKAGHGDAHESAARYGGQYVVVEGHHGVEMVAAETSLVFHLTEDHEPMDLSGGSFKAIVQSEAGTKVLPLTIEADKLTASLDAPLIKGAKIALSGKDGHGHTIQARFVKE